MKFHTRKWRNDFNNQSSYDPYYDLFDDWDLIESSFAQQYGIRLRKNISEMEWGEFSSLLSGVNSETPLGNIVRIRSEKDPEALKKFSPEEKRIRNEWLKKSASKITEEDYEQAMENFKAMFKNMAEKGR
ncbi:MAG: hypothetical protein IJ220_08260 [Clostridia bacterium]|nr:hypothetical protein [Clostridia bacterium]